MRLFVLDHDGGLLHDAIKRQRAVEEARTGLHVSDICNSILSRLNRYGDIDDASRLAFQEIGNAFEDLCARELRRRVPDWRKPQPRADTDGVIGSPDGYRPRARAIDEIKANWISIENTKKPFVEIDGAGHIISESTKFFGYRIQAMKYAEMWECHRIYFHVCFMRGTAFSLFPFFRTYTLTVTDDDLALNSAMLRQHAVDMGRLAA